MEPTPLEQAPNSSEAELGIIGCLMLDPELVHDLSAAHVTLDWFYTYTNRIVADAIITMVGDRQAVDIITLSERLKSTGQLEGIGGAAYLVEASNSVPSSANFPHYLEILREKTAQRRVAATCAATVSNLREGIPPDIDKIEASLADARSVGTPVDSKTVSSKVATAQFVKWLEERTMSHGKISGVPTGISKLDRMIDGIQYSELTLIAARPSIGKTALGCCLAANAIEEGIPTLFVTAEMSNRMIMRRIAANKARVSISKMRTGDLSKDEWSRLCVHNLKIIEQPLFLEEQMGGATIGKLIAAIRFNIRKHGVRFVVIDYIQKYRGDNQREKKTEELAEVVGKLQGIARETGIAVVALAQLNRENEKEKKTRKPKLTDLGDSKQLEQDADTVIAIHRDRSETCGEAELCVIKQRDGECGDVKCHYEGQYCRFSNLETTVDPQAR